MCRRCQAGYRFSDLFVGGRMLFEVGMTNNGGADTEYSVVRILMHILKSISGNK